MQGKLQVAWSIVDIEGTCDFSLRARLYQTHRYAYSDVVRAAHPDVASAGGVIGAGEFGFGEPWPNSFEETGVADRNFNW
jgi:hypothetical protein